jgi:hypothetical protein
LLHNLTVVDFDTKGADGADCGRASCFACLNVEPGAVLAALHFVAINQAGLAEGGVLVRTHVLGAIRLTIPHSASMRPFTCAGTTWPGRSASSGRTATKSLIDAASPRPGVDVRELRLDDVEHVPGGAGAARLGVDRVAAVPDQVGIDEDLPVGVARGPLLQHVVVACD